MISSVSYPSIGAKYWYIKDGSIGCGILDSVKKTILMEFEETELYFVSNNKTTIITDNLVFSTPSMASTAMMMFAENGSYPNGDVLEIIYDLTVPVDQTQQVWFIPNDTNSIMSGYVIKTEVRINSETIKEYYTLTVGSDASTVYKNPFFITTDLLEATEALDQLVDIC